MLTQPKNRCKDCGRSFVVRREQKQERVFRTPLWFHEYILEGYSSRQIAKQSGKLEYLVRRDIQSRLDANEIDCIDEIFLDVHYLMLDGYALPRAPGCANSYILLVYYEYIQEKVVWFSIRDGEKKEYILEDLRFLRDQMGYTQINTGISDGWLQIASALKEIYPMIIHQRCLVHIQRQVKGYISGNPRTKAWKQLKHITSYLVLSDPFLFPLLFQIWVNTYHYFLNEKSITQKGWWTWTHKNLRKAMKHVQNALPSMFQSDKYNDPNIEQTTNKLEWYFWVLTEEWYHEHKWLCRKRLLSFTSLWIYLRNQK